MKVFAVGMPIGMSVDGWSKDRSADGGRHGEHRQGLRSGSYAVRGNDASDSGD